MILERLIYLDIPGLASLYAQLKGEDVTETYLSIEQQKSTGLKLAIAAFLGVSAGVGSKNSCKESKSVKTSIRPENMLREVAASLRAAGKLKCSIEDAIQDISTTEDPIWFEGRHGFSVPPDSIHEMNENRTLMFVAGMAPYVEDTSTPRILMSASLNHCPEAHNGVLGISGHLALFFRQMAGRPHNYKIFGSFFRSGDEFQIKPYAIRQ